MLGARAQASGEPSVLRFRRDLVAVAAALLLSGCSLFQQELVGKPNDQVRDVVPGQWSGAAEAQPLGDGWLRDFNDPQLERLVQEVWANNGPLLAAVAQRDQAAAMARIEAADLYPHFDAHANAGRTHQINDFLDSGNPISQYFVPQESYITRLRVGVGVDWELDLWGRQRNNADARLGDVWSASLDIESAKFSLAAQAVSRWFDLVAAEHRVRLTEQLVASYERTVRVADSRFAPGLMSSEDLREAKNAYTAARAELVTRRLERGRAARALELLLGRYPGDQLRAGVELPALPAPLSAGVPSQLLERRPDVQAAALRVLASDQRLLAAKKNLLPSFQIQGYYDTQAKYVDKLFNGDNFVWQIGGGILQPLFYGGQIRAGIKAQRAVMFEEIYRYRDKVLTAFREVEDGLAADQLLREQLGYVQETAALARENEDAARASFDNGTLDSSIYLGAQRGVTQAQMTQLDLNTALLQNRVALALALGGSPLPAPPPAAGGDAASAEADASVTRAGEPGPPLAGDPPPAAGGAAAAEPRPLPPPHRKR